MSMNCAIMIIVFLIFKIFIIGVIITAVECSFFKLNNVYLYVFTFILIRLTS